MTVIPEAQINQFRAFATSSATRLRGDADTARAKLTIGVFPGAVAKFLGVLSRTRAQARWGARCAAAFDTT